MLPSWLLHILAFQMPDAEHVIIEDEDQLGYEQVRIPDCPGTVEEFLRISRPDEPADTL